MRACFALGALALLFAPVSAHPQGDSAVVALVRAGDSAYAAGSKTQAIAAYRAALRRDSTASSRSVYRLAVLLAEDGAFSQAIVLHKLYNRLEPNDKEGIVALARTYSWASRYDEALELYGAVLAREPDHRTAALGSAQVLGWAGRYPESIAAYRGWLVRHPDDREAVLAQARTFAWWGKLAESVRLYDSLSLLHADADARKGLALVAAWQGDLVRSERLWRDLARELPNDAEIWTGLAQVLRWRGQSFDARDALDRALTLDPNHRDARSQRRWLESELSPTLSGGVVGTGDSDDNAAQVYRIQAASQPWRFAALRLDAQHVRAQLSGIERVAETARAQLIMRLPWRAGGWTGRVEAGANRRAIPGARTLAVGQLSLAGRLSRRMHAELRAVRSVLDETVPLIDNGIRANSVEGDWETQLGDRFNLSASLGRSALHSDSGSNTRSAGSLSLRWMMTRARSFALTARSLQHHREATDGYFSPRRYTHVELSARTRIGRDLGWSFAGDAGAGAQYVDYRGSRRTLPTQRLTGALSYVFAPGLEWTLTGVLANVATAVTSSASDYRFGSLSLGGRVPLR